MTAKRIDEKQLLCLSCGKEMRFDDKEELARGKYKVWYLCDGCGTSCIVNEQTGESSWMDANGVDLDIPLR